MRLAYLGTPEMAVPSLQALVEAGHEVALVVSRADKPRGRGGKVQPSPVKAAALELGLPVTDRIDDVLEAGVDLGVVVAYGRLVKRHILDALPLVNVHFSLLPRWRGAAPVERAILAGDDKTGVCLMALEEELDTGPVYARTELSIGPDETLSHLRERLVEAGSSLLIENLATGLGTPEPQTGEPTYAAKLDTDDFRLDWALPAVELYRTIRLERAWTTFRGKRLKILAARPTAASELAPGQLQGVEVGTGRGGLELERVQPEGRRPQDAEAWRNGARPDPDEALGS